MHDSPQQRRTGARWTALGAVLIVGAFVLVLTSREQGRQLVDALSHYWPYLLLTLAGGNVLRIALADGSWIAPLVVGLAGAVGLLVRSGGVGLLHGLLSILPSGLLVLGLSFIWRGRTTRRRNVVFAQFISRCLIWEGELDQRLRVSAYLAELRVDLTQVNWASGITLRVTVVLGRVRLCVPHGLNIVLADDSAVGVTLHENGSRHVTGTPEVKIEISGAIGRIDVARG